MQKKVKSKLTDTLFVIVCLVGTALSIWKFTVLFYQTLTKDEIPIAQIEIKRNTVQRRFLDDILWDRLKDKSLLYNGDTIRTAPISEATVSFPNGNEIELLPSSMIQISMSKEDVAEAQYQQGSINVKAGENGLSLKYKDSSINLEEGTSISTDEDESGNLTMQVVDGKVVIENQNGTETVISGNIATITNDGSLTHNHLNVISPVLSKKYLNFSENDYLLNFEWTSDQDSVLIETSDTKSFEKILSAQKVTSSKRIGIPVKNGITFWRIKTISQNENEITESVTGKVNVIYSPVPSLISPTKENNYNYRTRNPIIRFNWSEVEYASTYQIDVADNPEMKNPIISDRTTQTSAVFNTLSEGNWYWRVTPFFIINNIGLGESSLTETFQITKNNLLSAPELTIPVENAFVSTKIPMDNGSFTYKTINFSWKNDNEAESYNLKIWPESGSYDKPEINISKITQNNCNIKSSDYNIYNGNWYWCVEKVDDEDNIIKSEFRKFYAMDTKVEQRTIFPPDGYTVAQTRSQDLRFNWKTNITSGTTFQIAKDEDFKKIVISESTIANSITGKNLTKGTYYWRIKTTLGQTDFYSPTKMFIVDLPFDAPKTIIPSNNGSVVVRPKTPYEFRWQAVAGADYYQIKIARASNPNVILVDKNLIEPISNDYVQTKLNLDNLYEGNYIFTIQGFRQETEKASRSSGYIANYNFNLKMLKPVKLLTPEDSIIIDGATAIKNPPTLSWQTIDEPVTMSLVIYKKEISKENEVHRLKTTGSSFKMPPIYEGSYLWKIEAYTKDGFDISSIEARKIKVTEIPKLDAPNMIEPKKNSSLGKEYFKTNKQIVFKWGRVSKADQYIFTLKNDKDQVILTKTFNKNTTEFVLTDLSILSKGKMTWVVEAQSLYNGILFQNGKTNPTKIKIDLGQIKNIKLNDTGTMYGK